MIYDLFRHVFLYILCVHYNFGTGLPLHHSDRDRIPQRLGVCVRLSVPRLEGALLRNSGEVDGLDRQEKSQEADIEILTLTQIVVVRASPSIAVANRQDSISR